MTPFRPLMRACPARLMLALMLVLLWPAALLGQSPEATRVAEIRSGLTETQNALAAMVEPSPGDLSRLLEQATALRAASTACVQSTTAQQAKLAEDLELLGPRSRDDSAEVMAKRDGLLAVQAQTAKRLADCRLLVLETQNLVAQITGLQQQVLAKRLLTRGLDFPTILALNLSEPLAWLEFAHQFLLRDSGLAALPWVAFAGLLLIGGLGVVLGMRLRRLLLAHFTRHTLTPGMTGGLIRSALATSALYAPFLITAAAVAVYLTLVSLGQWPLPFITLLSYGLALYYLLVGFIRLMLAPAPPAAPFLPLPADLTARLAQRLQVLSLLLLLGFLLFTTLLSWKLPERQFLLVRGVYVAFLALNMIWVTWLVGRLTQMRSGRGLGVLLALVLLAAVVAEWFGYRNLTVFLMLGLVGSLLGLGLMLLLSRLLGELFDSLDEGRYGWERHLRRAIGLQPGEYVPGLNWLRFLANLALLAGLAYWLLRIWGLSDAGFAAIGRYLTEGFTVAGFNIVPTRLLWAVLVFALLLTFFRWFKQQLADRWTSKLRVDRGAREAIVTTTGYLGGAIAFLVMLSIAGIEFTNLAIIAGALSVGIGFGLQNVVNNFVSGLILLLERPIRTGDWIVVGGTEGYVKSINIRSTQIQTFDRADVIVPNSELISGQVVNWMLGDPYGRVKVPVGVAYGSDTAKVKEILLKVGNEHPLTIHGNPNVPEPSVLFLGFGDSSLDFELRCVIREVDKRLSVLSDLNFAIDAAFREHGIEIPFPQRDLHLRGWPAPGPVPPESP